MLTKEHKNLDAVCVGTPDHMHAPMAMASMHLGLPVYQQKPMAHSVHEVHMLTAMARKKNLVTQMGIQIHSAREYKTAVATDAGGAIGKIKEVHSFSEKKWGDSDPLPERTDPVPSTLNWDHWIGVAQPRPFILDVYHPVNWRKRIDFGTATFGDMGCHILDPVFGALGLAAPLSVRSEGAAPNGQSWALNPSSTTFSRAPRTPRKDDPHYLVRWRRPSAAGNSGAARPRKLPARARSLSAPRA